jgi:hypothetical protein
MALIRLRVLSSLLAALLVFPYSSLAFDTPLSDTAVREAYFMGQRHDESYGHFLDRYYKHLPPPKTGPYISRAGFLTPYALMTQRSGEHFPGYSAQQAELDHRKQVEPVKVLVTILFTDTYPAVMPNPNGRTTGTPWDYLPRPSDFWRDFRIQVSSDDRTLTPFIYSGEPDYVCGDGYCSLVGATVQLEFLAEAFSSDSATVQIDPPEGDQVAVDFDLISLR